MFGSILIDDSFVGLPQIKWLWDILGEMTIVQRRQFLSFLTGSDRVPISGLAGVPFTVQRHHAHSGNRQRASSIGNRSASSTTTSSSTTSTTTTPTTATTTSTDINSASSSEEDSQSDDQHLPSASTCYHVLLLPPYSSIAILKEKLLMAIELGGKGFGFA